jgi:hypothetical protein
MITKDIESYLRSKYKKTTIYDITHRDNGKVHVKFGEDKLSYSYDDIIKGIFNNINPPSSADGIYINDDTVYLVEFKGGATKRISKDNFDEKRCLCKETGKSCREYGKLLIRNSDLEHQVILSNLQLKVIESYHVLDKIILPNCNVCAQQYKLKFLIVVDVKENPYDLREDIMSELAHKEVKPTDNIYSELKASTARYKIKAGINSIGLYDDIMLIPVQKYEAMYLPE